MNPRLHERAVHLTDRTVATRRDLHAHPEIAFEEVRTMGVIEGRLRELGLSPRVGVGGTGVVAVWDSGRAGPTVLVRADMDALPVPDDKTVSYRSTADGRNHACGHDGHVAVALSACEALLAEGDALCGRIVFVFQPAEEIVRGARAMLDDGALEGLEVDHVVGLHLSTMHPTGVVAVREGPAMAAADTFRIVVHGRGGHAAKPHETVDPIVVLAETITTLQTLVSRGTDPADQAVVSVTRVAAGSAFNIIPERAEAAGTVRSFAPDTRERLWTRLREVADGVAALHGATAEVELHAGSPAVVNDVGATERLRRVATRVVGEERVIRPARLMGGDDMALWLQQAPGCYFFVGARGGEGSAWPHHHPRFDLDEAALPVAVEVLASAVADLLEPADA